LIFTLNNNRISQFLKVKGFEFMVACQMSHKNKILLVLALSILTWPIFNGTVARAQDPFSSLISRIPAISGIVESDFPGATIPSYPFLHTPRFGGEFRVTPIFYTLVNAKFLSPENALALKFKNDLGYEDQASLIELSGRLQFNRLSVRGHYDAYLRTLRGGGAGGYFWWPDFRFGFDFDLLQRPNIKFGIDMDMCWERPSFALASPVYGNFSVVGPRPVTFGVHGWYNPECFTTISPVLEVRYRWPIRTGTKIYELEIAAGLKLPRTVLGESALRAGWRRSQIEFSGEGNTVDVTLSGAFAEYVFYY
jgi:hypothetical protein